MSRHPLIIPSDALIVSVQDCRLCAACKSAVSQTDNDIGQLALEYCIPTVSWCDPDRPGFDKLQVHQRDCLIVYGALLESAVTQTTLSALLEGFDVFVVVDHCPTAEPLFTPSFHTRIQQHGATLVTLAQLKRELNWSSQRGQSINH